MIANDFQSHLRQLGAALAGVEGWLSEREVEFLALLAASPTGTGAIVELGSFHGKSTIALASSSQLADGALVHTVDCEPDLPARRNLARLGLDGHVRLHTCLSADFTAKWGGAIRLLWHDGSNKEEVVRHDFLSLQPFLVNRAMVAFHDVLNPSGERVRVFIEDVLKSDHFGHAGVCGSIGWAQYDASGRATHRRTNDRLIRRLERLLPYQVADQPPPRGLAKVRYKLMRAMVPHRRVRVAHLARLLAPAGSAALA